MTESRRDPLRDVTVEEVMSSPLVTCGSDVSLRSVAALMSRNGIHAVVVLGGRDGGDAMWGVVSDADLVRAAGEPISETTAACVAGTPHLIRADLPLGAATRLMAERGVTHLVATDEAGEPVGVVSALDVARALAAPPAPASAPEPPAESRLRAAPGDRLVIRGHHLGERDRDAEILEARGAEGTPPFLVRWDDGRVTLLYPGSDARVDAPAARHPVAQG
ncbi:MAG: DUF1918 domain-containing protein [Thermoleophilia bacterium]